MAKNYCSEQMKVSDIYGWHVYVISVPWFSKIGTAARVAVRICSLQNGSPHKIKVDAIWHFKDRHEAMVVEQEALRIPVVNRLPGRDWCECEPEIAFAAVAATITARNSEAKLISGAASP